MVEVERAAQAASTTPEKMLEASYRLHTIEATDLAVLDLITSDAREAVGLEDDDIYGDDWSACQAVGHAAWFLHVQGVLVPAAGELAWSSPPTNNGPAPVSSTSATARI